ncbi:hypothetical protein BGX31_007955 [Mortierella sp. GBA43]|nr:hypothetical protein BGX31_007955 [Mortierella sp. GBA43]
MIFGSIVASPRGSLSPLQALNLAKVYLENARKETDGTIMLVLCHDTEVSLLQARRAAKHAKDNAVSDGVAVAYIDLGKFLYSRGRHTEAQASFKKAQKLGVQAHDIDQLAQISRPTSAAGSIKSAPATTVDAPVIKALPPPDSLETATPDTTDPSSLSISLDVAPSTPIDAIPVTSVVHLDTTLSTTGGQHIHDTDTVTTPLADIATVPLNIFVGNVRAPTITFKPPEVDERLNDTLQLACSLGLLQAFISPDDILDPAVRNWLQVTQIDTDEQERLKAMATDVIRAFKRDELKDVKAVAEVVYLSPVLEKEDFQYLLREFYSGIDQSGLLNVHQLEGLAQLIQGAKPGYLEADDLVKILQLLSTRLQDTHRQSPVRIYKLTLAVSHVLDAMADAEIKDLDRERLHEPLSLYLDGMKRSSDTYLVYQAAYAYQALLCVPDDETLWQATLRRSGKVVQGVSRLMSAVKGLDLNGFIEGLKDIQGGLAGASEVARIVKDAYDGARSLAEGGQRFLECIKEGFSFSRKCAWYPALRGADILIREGQFAKFRKLVCEAPCRRDQAFQWGVCQRLGDIAVNPILDIDTRRSAIEFLGEIYQNDGEWGQHTAVKQWVLEILMQLSSFPMDDMHFLDSVLQELGKGGDAKKQALYRTCREDGYGSYPLEVVSPSIGSPSLLDRVQERLDVEGVLRQLKKQRLKARRNAIYIPPQAKPNLQASEESRFSLMEAAKGSLANKEQVFLVLGDSGSGKSTFSRELECQLWHEYKKNGPIPLHINLPAIDKPEHDMIAKQLRKAEFTEPQIRELKLYRRFILICDGYDESQQTHNLYTSNRLNEPGEWSAKMVISCRSEYLGVDYRDRFQPGDRNQRSEAPSLQEAVITPFSLDQVQEYIDQYVSVNRPLWETNQYKQALDGIPSLKELVKNPFLMALSLEVLPRMVDPGQNLSATRITRVALYDQFIEHWLERGKKRIGEKNMGPQARSAFENLIEEGFTQNGVNFLKRLSVAIHKYQDGQPIVQYTHYKDSTSWKAEFFSREEDNQLLREACPLIRNGNQHRFIHRSLLEYGLALAVFDPQELKGTKAASAPSDRRASVSSDASFVLGPTVEVTTSSTGQEPDLNSPLIWRSFVNDLSILQFLEERVQQEPMFKKQLLDYIDFSKTDKKFRTAAANAITILVRAGMQFNYADLRGIKIPGADISYGFFDSAQLQEADLRHVNLRGACMPQANLSNAQMSGVQFGELPYLPQESKVVSTKYSPDGKSFAVGLDNGGINVYATSNWTIMWKSKEHSGKVLSISYSPTRNQIASSSEDKTLRLWDETGVCRHLLIGHEAKVNCIAHSVQGGLIASAGYDRTIRLWDTATGDCKSTLKGHDGNVADTVFSPKGNQLATCSWDATIRLWDVESDRFY